jgi:hypothetical protein
MSFFKNQTHKISRWMNVHPFAVHASCVLLGALLLAWPAVYNGFPLLYPDSLSYLSDGTVVARAILLHQLNAYSTGRSNIYSLGILPFHWHLPLWPVIALQCLLAAWIIWLVVRSVAPRRLALRYLLLILFLSLLTSVSWYASFVMPDIFGPLLYLTLYLLAFARETLSRTERWALYLFAFWGITSHTSHLLLAGGLWLLLVLLAFLAPRRLPGRWRVLAVWTVILAVAATVQIALNGYLYGKPSLSGRHPPYLMARVLADGPGQWYLEQHCSQLHWTVCDHYSQVNGDSENFLWGDNGYANASIPDRRKMDAEEMPLVLAAVRAYPGKQWDHSVANCREQLLAFGLRGFYSNAWVLSQLDGTLPGEQPSYLKGRQARNALPIVWLSTLQYWVILGSLTAIVLLTALLWRSLDTKLVGLGLVIAATVIANALVAGTLSVVNDRYQSRVIWLIALWAGVLFLDWLQKREGAPG